MKSFKFLAIAAATASSLFFLPAFAQSQASFKKGGVDQATCSYTGLTIASGVLVIDCSTDVSYTGGQPTGGTGPYALTVALSPPAGGTLSSASCAPTGCVGVSILGGTTVNLTVSPATGYTFANWSGGPCSGVTTATCSFPMNGPYNISANFTASGGTPPPPVPAGCTGLTPTSNYEARTSFGPAGQSSVHYGKAGITYSYPLPMMKTGLVGTTSHPFTPGGIIMEVALSQCPGDMSYYKSAAAKYAQYGTLQVPCGNSGPPESIGVKWAPSVLAWDAYCIAPAQTTQWYVNFRYTVGCDGGASCPMYYFWQANN